MIMRKRSFILLGVTLFSVILSGCTKKQEPVHEHTYATEWSSNETEHWHAATCEHKDLKADVGVHKDEDHNGKCDTCSYVMEVIPTKATITVVNGTGSGEYEIGSQATATALVNPGDKFKEWQVNGLKVSEENPYTFTVTESITLVAITEPIVAPDPMAKYTRTLTMTGDSFKVLNLTDSQLHDGDNFNDFKHIVDTLVEREQPDLITILGDIINDDAVYGVETNARKTVQLLDSYDIPWAPVFGNHDNLEYQTPYTSMKTGGVPFLMSLFAECDNCLFIEGPDEVLGKSNYMVNIVDTNGAMVETFVFLDSFTNGLQDSSVTFYESCIEYSKKLNDGNTVPSVMFDHIPLPEYTNAWNEARDSEYHNGFKGNPGNVPLSAGTTNMFQKIKSLGSTSSVICGHDHESAFVTDYQGINLVYAMKSSLGDNKEDNNYTHPLGGLVLEVGSGKDEFRFSRVEDVTYDLKVGGELAFHIGVLPYWRMSGVKLGFDVELPSDGHFQFNIQGSNFQRGSETEKNRKGDWNRLTNNTDIGTDVANTADFGTATNIGGNKYRYEADISKWTLNSGEDACGDETAKIVYFHNVKRGNFKITNIHWIYPEIPDNNQADLKDAVIADIPEVSFYGLPVKPEPKVTLNGETLVKGDDIIYEYLNNGAVGTATLRVIPSGKGALKYKGSATKTFTVVTGQVIRGEQFKVGADYSKDISPVKLDHVLYLDIKFTSASTTRINVFLGDGWDNYFGYYSLDANTTSDKFACVEVDKTLEDGYIRFKFDLLALKTSGNAKVNDTVGRSADNINKINLVYIRGAWSDASGYIDIGEEEKQVEKNRGELKTGSSKADITCYPYKVLEGGTLTIDYAFVEGATSTQGISLYLGTDRGHCFGSFKIYKDRLDSKFDGFEFDTCDDGYCRITINISGVTKVHQNSDGAPTVIDRVMFDYFEASGGAYFDVNPEGNGKDVTLTMKGDSLKVANFTDIHIQSSNTLNDGSPVRKTIEYGMTNSQPDAVVFSGDFIHALTDVSLIKQLCDFMDTFGVPYFFVFGNHDREKMDAKTIAENIWKSEYGYIDLGPSSLDYGANYIVKVNNSSGELVHALIMMDTKNKRANDESLIEYVDTKVNGVHYGEHNGRTTYCADGWDGVKGAQIDWYKDAVTELGVETTVFMHAGMIEYVKAYENYRLAVISGDQSAIDACAPVGHCNMGEYCCGPCANYGFFAAIKLMDSTKNVICGHDHLNDYSLMYQGVRLTYAVKTGDGAYGGVADKSGYTVLTIGNTGSTSLNQMYYDYTA